MINMSEKTECPHCGKMYSRLSVHLLYCKEKPVEDEAEYLELPDIDEDITTTYEPTETHNTLNDEFTPIFEDSITSMSVDELEPIVEAQTSPCPYLAIIAGQACSSCRGTSCMASADKKISDADFCKYEWPDCIIYEEGKAAGVRAMCPYLGLTIPEGRSACCGMWCHARDSGVRVVKVCYRYGSCGRYLQAKGDGKPFYRKAII